MKEKVEISSRGIKRVLNKYNFSKAVSEYVWNGFDAGADKVEVVCKFSGGVLQKLEINDNGSGINYDELIKKFKPFYDSHKEDEDDFHHSKLHGRNGYGRLTFFKFAYRAKWETVYKSEKNMVYNINIDANNLQNYEEDKPKETKNELGTKVTFEGFIKEVNKTELLVELKDYLKIEFGWFLELNKKKNYKLLLNREELDYTDLIAEKEEFDINPTGEKEPFKIKYIRWKESINEEGSKIYYLDPDLNEIYKEYSSFNRQGDYFYPSIYVSNKYFKTFNFHSNEASQNALIGGARNDKIFREIQGEIYGYLSKKRKPLLKENSDKLIVQLEEDGIIKKKVEDSFEKIKNEDLKEVVREIYEIQPTVFKDLKPDQRKVFIGFLDLVLDSDEREKVLDIIDQIVKLTPQERSELQEVLQYTKMGRIIKTINLLKERFKVIECLKRLVFKKELKANERDHLQKVIASNYWIFGEQYNLVSEDDNFQKSLENYLWILDGILTKPKIKTEEYKLKRVDLFLCRRRKERDTIKNVLVELKSPNINLGSKEYLQVDKYRQIILNESEFKSNHAKWDFILIGNDFSEDSFIQGQIESNKNHGEPNLAYCVDNFKIYVKRWCDIFDEFEMAYEFLDSKLKLEKEKLVEDLDTAKKIVEYAKVTELARKKGSLPLKVSSAS